MSGYEVSTDPARLDVAVIHRFLSEDSYWCPGVPYDVVERSIAGSIPFGLYAPDGSQAGFARAVTDAATFAWIGDVFVLPEHRGRGLGVFLMEQVLAHPRLQGLRQIALRTADAQGLYARFGFAAPPVHDLLVKAGAPYGD